MNQVDGEMPLSGADEERLFPERELNNPPPNTASSSIAGTEQLQLDGATTSTHAYEGRREALWCKAKGEDLRKSGKVLDAWPFYERAWLIQSNTLHPTILRLQSA